MRKFLTVLITALALFVLTIPVFAGGSHEEDTWCHFDQGQPGELRGSTAQGGGHKNHELDFKIETDEDLARCIGTTTTTVPEETTTTAPVPDVEVCRDEKLITIPADQVLDTDDRVFNDFQRDNCEPRPATPPNPTPPGPVIQFPPISVGYACPGTDGVVVELPWGTYEDLLPTPEQAAQTCPVLPVVVEAPTTTEVLTVLPFTGLSDSLPFLALAGLAALGLGGLMVRSARSDG